MCVCVCGKNSLILIPLPPSSRGSEHPTNGYPTKPVNDSTSSQMVGNVVGTLANCIVNTSFTARSQAA